MANSGFKLDYAAFGREVMRADYMVQAMREVADQIQSRAGEGYEASAKKGNRRALAMVRTATPDAMRDNVENNTLEKALQ